MCVAEYIHTKHLYLFISFQGDIGDIPNHTSDMPYRTLRGRPGPSVSNNKR